MKLFNCEYFAENHAKDYQIEMSVDNVIIDDSISFQLNVSKESYIFNILDWINNILIDRVLPIDINFLKDKIGSISVGFPYYNKSIRKEIIREENITKENKTKEIIREESSANNKTPHLYPMLSIKIEMTNLLPIVRSFMKDTPLFILKSASSEFPLCIFNNL